FWTMEDVPRPLWLLPNSPTMVQGLALLQQGKSLRELLFDKEVQLAASLRHIEGMEIAQAHFAFDDAINHLQPYQGVPIFASAFGCKIENFDHQLPASRPLVGGDRASAEVLRLGLPPVDAGMLGDILEMTSYFEKATGGRYPIAVTDLQSPMDNAYLVWNSCDFMVAMYTDKEAVHHLLRLCTDLFIGFVKEMRSRVSTFIPAHFPPVYLPDGKGVALSEDTLAVLSPDLFVEFALPYLNEVSEEFGGLFVHPFGTFEHQLPGMKKIRGLRGVNFSVSATRFEAVRDALGDHCCLIPHCSAENIVRSFGSTEEWVTCVLKAKKGNRGLGLVVVPDGARNAGPAKDAPTEPFPAFMGRMSALIGRYA
ncbi:MAG: uroporphyrinogen decarboxylase family protein, partial [Spirochaetota bacterium]